VLWSRKSANGAIKTSLAMAPMNVKSSDHLPASKCVMDAQVIAPAEEQRFVTHMAVTDLKFRLSVVPASKASQEFQIIPVSEAGTWCCGVDAVPNAKACALKTCVIDLEGTTSTDSSSSPSRHYICGPRLAPAKSKTPSSPSTPVSDQTMCANGRYMKVAQSCGLSAALPGHGGLGDMIRR
jgi:hypothetical protein